MLRSRKKRKAAAASDAESGGDVEESKPRRKARKRVLFAAIAGLGAWAFAKTRRSGSEGEAS